MEKESIKDGDFYLYVPAKEKYDSVSELIELVYKHYNPDSK